MVNWLFKIIFGTQNQRTLKKLAPTVARINALEPDMARLSDADLRAKTDEFRARVSKGTALDDLLPEAFAAVREASKRSIGLRHFDVQLIGGMALHQGKIAEMRTGEGKTLVATLAAYLNSLSGLGVHIVTVNDYLAKRDRHWMGPVFEFLGLTVGFVQHDMRNETRRQAYACDVTYVTNNEIGFDYLRDNLVVRKEDRVLKPFHFAIVDEVDSILVDEARTPLIISGPAEQSSQRYYVTNQLVPHLKGRKVSEQEEMEAKYKGIDLGEGYDYLIDEKAQTATLTEQGISKCERLLNVKSLYDDIQGEWVHHITQALRAHNFYHRDVEYVIKEGEVIIVDEFTGRLMPGRRWSEGLHQAVEAKEGLRIAEENQTLATITFQNFFKLYKKLAGMTGTALTEAAEFWTIYKLDVMEIPTNRPAGRVDNPDRVFRTEREKYEALTAEVEERWKEGQPILLGTRSIEKSEKLSAMLKRKGIPHQVLNAKYHEQEAQIITQAGRKGAITIATNMAGRGTDIVLGGNPPDPAEAELVKAAGGLYVIGSERHEARRIDNQLRGRCGRQGDPGRSRFYLSLEDELMRLFGSERVSTLMQKLGMQEGEDIQHPWVNKAIENAQRKVEAMNFDIRKQLLDFDKVMSKQREGIYALRNSILDGENISERIRKMISESAEEKAAVWAPKDADPQTWDLPSLKAWIKRSFGREIEFDPALLEDAERFSLELQDSLLKAYEAREGELGGESARELERMVLLTVIDSAWVEHLTYLEQLKRGIFLRAYGQKDPVIEFQKEAFNLFEAMMQRIRDDTVEYMFRIQAPQAVAPKEEVAMTSVKADFDLSAAAGRAGASTDELGLGVPAPRGSLPGRPSRPAPGGSGSKPLTVQKVGRNDPCPCGSGKKYKKCCGNK